MRISIITIGTKMPRWVDQGVEELRPLDISSTEIRDMLAEGRSARYLLPEPVLDYIQERHLYQ